MRATLLTILFITAGCARLPGPIESDRELRARATGERVTVRGRIGAGGLTDMVEGMVERAPDREKPPNTTPQFELTLGDGTRVVCGFAATPRAGYEAWLKRNPPGTVVTVEGTNTGAPPDNLYLLAGCRVVPNGFQ